MWQKSTQNCSFSSIKEEKLKKLYIFTDNSPTKGNSEALTNVKKANGNQDDAQRHSGSEVRDTVSKFISRELSFWLKATNKSGDTKLFS